MSLIYRGGHINKSIQVDKQTIEEALSYFLWWLRAIQSLVLEAYPDLVDFPLSDPNLIIKAPFVKLQLSCVHGYLSGSSSSI